MSLCQTPNHILLWRNQLQLPWFRSFGGEFLLGRPSREKRCFCLSEFLFSLSLLLRRVSLIFLLVLTCFLCCKWKEEGGGWWSCSQVYWLKSWKSWWQRRRWSWKGGWCPQGGRHSSWKRWDDNWKLQHRLFSTKSTQVPDAAVINMKANFVLPEVTNLSGNYFYSKILPVHAILFAGRGGLLFYGCLHRACPTRDSNDCLPGLKTQQTYLRKV